MRLLELILELVSAFLSLASQKQKTSAEQDKALTKHYGDTIDEQLNVKKTQSSIDRFDADELFSKDPFDQGSASSDSKR